MIYNLFVVFEKSPVGKLIFSDNTIIGNHIYNFKSPFLYSFLKTRSISYQF